MLAGRASASGHGRQGPVVGPVCPPAGPAPLYTPPTTGQILIIISFSSQLYYFLLPPSDASYWGKSGSGKGDVDAPLNGNSERATWPMDGNQPGWK
jgi:hypothetical protein